MQSFFCCFFLIIYLVKTRTTSLWGHWYPQVLFQAVLTVFYQMQLTHPTRSFRSETQPCVNLLQQCILMSIYRPVHTASSTEASKIFITHQIYGGWV